MWIDLSQIVICGLALLPLILLGWLVRTYALRMRSEARRKSRRARLLNDIPAEMRWRVFERDCYTCQRCGTESDLLVDFVDDMPDKGAVRLSGLVTRCVRCSAIARRSDKIG